MIIARIDMRRASIHHERKVLYFTAVHHFDKLLASRSPKAHVPRRINRNSKAYDSDSYNRIRSYHMVEYLLFASREVFCRPYKWPQSGESAALAAFIFRDFLI